VKVEAENPPIAHVDRFDWAINQIVQRRHLDSTLTTQKRTLGAIRRISTLSGHIKMPRKFATLCGGQHLF